MKASELIARCLENEGVKYVFGVPGEEILDIVDSLVDSSVRLSDFFSAVARMASSGLTRSRNM